MTGKRAYLFIDAENHFLRASECINEHLASANHIHNIENLAQSARTIHIDSCFPTRTSSRLLYDKQLQLLWDVEMIGSANFFHDTKAEIVRAIHVCSYQDRNLYHQISKAVREFDFEPAAILEPRAKKAQRKQSLDEYKLIEKAKGCDIAIATRMVKDAASDLYDYCILFSSDADFLPAIEAVRSMGKIVWVFGFANGISKESPFAYIPDQFVDLTRSISSYAIKQTKELDTKKKKKLAN